jgi:hypothetical protein
MSGGGYGCPPCSRVWLAHAFIAKQAENLAGLPTRCNVSTKRNSKGHQESWIGYKLHLDTIDGDIPVSAILTSASLHDSQVAIPLGQMTAERVTSCYDLMDGAYDSAQIRAFSRSLGHVPIISPNQRSGKNTVPLDPAQTERYKERSASERVNSLLKQRYGGRWVRVRGASKVMCHLMFGLIALTERTAARQQEYQAKVAARQAQREAGKKPQSPVKRKKVFHDILVHAMALRPKRTSSYFLALKTSCRCWRASMIHSCRANS